MRSDAVSYLWLGLALGLCLSPPAVAEETKVWRIGVCHVGLDHTPPNLPIMRAKLAELGYVIGKNLHLDFRNLADEAAAIETARTFVTRKVDLIVAFENQCARAMQRATASIPILFAGTSDPVRAGFVRSLAHPGANVTGTTQESVDAAKRVQLLKEIYPALKRLVVFTDPQDATQGNVLRIREAAGVLGIEVIERVAATAQEIETAFQSLASFADGAVIIASDRMLSQSSGRILALALRNRIAFVAHRREWVAAGGLFSYAADLAWSGVVLAIYIDKIFKGADPAALPVQRPTAFQLVINAKTAKTLNIDVPDAMLARADEVIE